MCKRTLCVLIFIVVLNLLDFIGDGFMLGVLITEYPRNFTSRDLMNLSYCQTRELRQNNQNSLINFFTLLVFFIIAVFALFMFPVVLRFSAFPKKSPYLDVTTQSVDNVDVEFRPHESGRRRALRYLMLLLFTFMHDFLLLPLGIGGFYDVISPHSERCEPLITNMNTFNATNSTLTIPLYTKDYFTLIFLGGKVVGVVGIVGFVLFAEFQYRYHRHLMQTAELLVLLRSNYLNDDSDESGDENPCFFFWLRSLCISFLITCSVLLLLFAPVLTVVLVRYRDVLQYIPSFEKRLETFCYVCWSIWGVVLLAIVCASWTLVFCRKLCKKML